MNPAKTIGTGIAIFFVCILVTRIIAYEFFYLTFGVCLILSLVVTALTLLFLRLHWRITRLETQVNALSRQLYQSKETH